MFFWKKSCQRVLPIESFSDNVIHGIFLHLKVKDIFSLIVLNKHFYLLLNTNLFWKDKFQKDLNLPPIDSTLPWKENYRRVLYGDLIVFGDNSFGELGLGDFSMRCHPIQVPGIKVKDVAAGVSHSLILDIYGDIYTAGFGTECCKFTRIPAPKAKAVFSAFETSYFIDLDSAVWVFGHINNNFVATPILLEGIKAKQIAIGYWFTAFIELDDNVLIMDNHTLERQFLPSANGFKPLKAKEISADNSRLALITLDYSVQTFVWDAGLNPAKFDSPLPEKARSISIGDYCILILDLDYSVWISRKNKLEKLNFKAIKVIAGYCYAMFIDPEGEVWGFGNNVCGSMGLGRHYKIRIPARIPGIKAIHVSNRTIHTLVIGRKVSSNDWLMQWFPEPVQCWFTQP